MAPRTRRALFSATLFLATCAILGSFINQKVAAQSASDESTLRDSLHSFTNVYSLVEQNYADPMNTDKTDKAIYDGAIPGMLHVLDPHSNFYDPKAFAQMREDQHGKYYGVGMTIQPQPVTNGGGKTKIVVLYPFEGTPSYKAGIRPGDEILTVDGKSTEGMDSAAVASLLKGARGTHVSVTMAREGSARPLVFDLVRDEIPRPSVDLAFLIRPGVGYIHVSSFIETTSREVGDALDKFGRQSTASSSTSAATPAASSTKPSTCPTSSSRRDRSSSPNAVAPSPTRSTVPPAAKRDHKYPIVVLVNRNTASAAEIVSGALQDHDRALIVGETTFGKGLVQTVFQITENTGLALTTYHYYTPSGRLIQRNYDHVSLYDYYYVRDDDAKTKDKSNLEVKLTDSGRTVYGGGGITPDEKIENVKSNHFQDNLLIHYAFFNFSKHYLATHTVTKDFVVDDAIMQQFKAFLKANQIDYTDADIAGVNDWVKESIKSELFTSQFGQLEGLKVRAQWDPQIAKAITFLPAAQALEDHSRLAQKTNTASR